MPFLLPVPALRGDRPGRFLPAMRYYAGNWDTSLWCFTPEAAARFESAITKAAALLAVQLTRLYGERVSDLLVHKGDGVPGDAQLPVEGELVAGVALG